MTPLHIAVGNGDLAIAKSLLDHSADVTARCTSVETWQGTPRTSPGELATKRCSPAQQYGAKE